MPTSLETDKNLESFGDKVARHIQNGEFNPSTLVRGFRQGWDELTLKRESDARLFNSATLEDYCGVEGLKATQYSLGVPMGPKGLSLPVNLPEQTIELRIYEFPSNSRLQIFVTPSDQLQNTSTFHKNVPDAIASITGPTYRFNWFDRLPNNGFYGDDFEDQAPFRGTEDPSQRRGAFGVTNEGDLKLLTDAQKWEVVNSGFEGYRFLVGSSYFILGDDSKNGCISEGSDKKEYLSYLAKFNLPEGEKFAYAICKRKTTRETMCRVLMDYADLQKGDLDIAVELEYTGATCVVKGARGPDWYGGMGFSQRRDHYVFVRA